MTERDAIMCHAANRSPYMIIGLAITAAIFLSGCIKMTTPYANESDVEIIWPYCESDAVCPTGREHLGLDIFMVESLKPFQAVADGKVEEIELFQNEIAGTWQVNVRIRYNWLYTVNYAFEPFSPNFDDGQQQLVNIRVSEGQRVTEGDTIGLLVHAGDAPHVHFHLDKSFLWWRSRPCPEPYFTDIARTSILEIIQRHPDIEQICY